MCVDFVAVPVKQTAFNEYNILSARLNFKVNIYLIISINSCGPFKCGCMNILRNI